MQKVIVMIVLVTSVFFAVLTWFQIPNILVMVLYMANICAYGSIIPFLSAICMNYIQAGQDLNFGLARGLGSIAYAVSAVAIGRLIDWINPTVPAAVYILFNILFLLVLRSLPEVAATAPTGGESSDSSTLFGVIKKYRTYFVFLLGISLSFSAAVALATYLINIVTSLGGTTSLYGVVVFVMAASEMPAMAITPRLLRRYSPETLLGVAGAAYIARNFIICLAPNIPVLIIGMLFQSISYGFFTAVTAYYVAQRLDHNDQIMGQTLVAVMTTGFGSTIGNLAGGFLQDAFGIQAMYIFAMVMTLLGSTMVILTAVKASRMVKQ